MTDGLGESGESAWWGGTPVTYRMWQREKKGRKEGEKKTYSGLDFFFLFHIYYHF